MCEYNMAMISEKEWKDTQREIDALKNRCWYLETELKGLKKHCTLTHPPVPDRPHDLMFLSVSLKENYIRGYVTGKFQMIEDIKRDNNSHRPRYQVTGYAHREDVEFILRHASGVYMQPELHQREGECG